MLQSGRISNGARRRFLSVFRSSRPTPSSRQEQCMSSSAPWILPSNHRLCHMHWDQFLLQGADCSMFRVVCSNAVLRSLFLFMLPRFSFALLPITRPPHPLPPPTKMSRLEPPRGLFPPPNFSHSWSLLLRPLTCIGTSSVGIKRIGRCSYCKATRSVPRSVELRCASVESPTW
jgi:hypothetical protein